MKECLQPAACFNLGKAVQVTQYGHYVEREGRRHVYEQCKAPPMRGFVPVRGIRVFRGYRR